MIRLFIPGISFLDTLVPHNIGNISIEVYRKPTHTDRYLDFNSHHEKKHENQHCCDTSTQSVKPTLATGITQELNRVNRALQSNGYPAKLISDITKKAARPSIFYTPKELVGMFFKWVDPSYPRSLH